MKRCSTVFAPSLTRQCFEMSNQHEDLIPGIALVCYLFCSEAAVEAQPAPIENYIFGVLS